MRDPKSDLEPNHGAVVDILGSIERFLDRAGAPLTDKQRAAFENVRADVKPAAAGSTRAIDAEFQREVGASLLGWIAATRGGRWRGPRGALDYVKVTEGTTDALVRDFVAWASGYSDHLVPGARDRMEELALVLLATTYKAEPTDEPTEVAS